MIRAQGSAATSVGRVRSVNEDSWYAGERLFLVADGMGGHAAGDVASRIAVEFLATLDREDVQRADVDAAVVGANSAILDHAGRHPQAAGMGTTVCGLVRGRDIWLVFNVGDSRCYELTRGTLRQVTVDHSEVQELVDLGHISQEEARVHPNRNVVTRALGQEPPPVVDYLTLPGGRGARYVLASDGLSSELTDTVIARLCADLSPADKLARQLVEAADDAGGHDNTTVVVVDDLEVAVEQDGGGGTRGGSSTVPRELIVREVAQ